MVDIHSPLTGAHQRRTPREPRATGFALGPSHPGVQAPSLDLFNERYRTEFDKGIKPV